MSLYTDEKIFQVTIVYLNSTHNRTECFYDQDEAEGFFEELFQERTGKEYIALFCSEIDPNPNQIRLIATWKKDLNAPEGKS